MYDGAGRLRVGGGFSMGDTIFSSKEGEGRIGGDVVSYLEYTIGTLYEGAEKKSSYLLQAFGHPSHWAHGGMKKCEGTSAFSEENPRDCRKSLLE